MPELNIPPAVWVVGALIGNGIVGLAVVMYFRVVHPSVLETHKQQMAAQAAGYEKQLEAQSRAATDSVKIVADLLRDEQATCRAERKRDQEMMAAEREKDREFRHQQAQLMQTALGELNMTLAAVQQSIEAGEKRARGRPSPG